MQATSSAWARSTFTAAAHFAQQRAFPEARQLLIALLEREPTHTDSMYLLASVVSQEGELELGEHLLRQALSIAPKKALYWVLLGNLLQRQNRLAESEICYQEALNLEGPGYTDAMYNWANTCERMGRHRDALTLLEEVIERAPKHMEARTNLANLLRSAGYHDLALAHLEEAYRSHPTALPVLVNLSNTLLALGRPVDALPILEKAITQSPNTAALYNNRGNVLRALRRNTEALASFSDAIGREPMRAEFWTNRGTMLQILGRMEEAVASFSQAIEFNPANPIAHGAALFSIHYDPKRSTADLLAEHRAWGERHGRALARTGPWRNEANPDRQLRVGFVSADFRQHPVSFFTEPLFAHHNRDAFHITAYSSCFGGDTWSARLKPLTDAWVDVPALTDVELAQRIEGDGIDVLIDLAGHTAGNRLLAFARKPAPVQISWLGYFNTTGLQAVDYLLVDPVVAPESEPAPFVEQPLRLPGCYLTYQGPDYAPEPARTPGQPLTYGCFNTSSKITANVVALWARILTADPEARLLLRNATFDDPLAREQFRQAFEAVGLAPERLNLQGAATHPELLATYAEIDIALDPFPYNGGTTTCEALWMGVPVVTLAGDRFVSRVGATILTAAGHPDWIAHTPEQYIDCALALGRDRTRLAELRQSLRSQVRTSTLGDTEAYTRNFEHALRTVWRQWCQSR
ncbi:MAG: tetratricopeptide repeat protein [Bryobacterales bacterium]|nr:tetratricopeptide repeat protein [Bryobacterales bacterium]